VTGKTSPTLPSGGRAPGEVEREVFNADTRLLARRVCKWVLLVQHLPERKAELVFGVLSGVSVGKRKAKVSYLFGA